MGKKKSSAKKRRGTSKQSAKPQRFQLCTRKRCLTILSSARVQLSFLIAIGGLLFLIWPHLSVVPGPDLNPYRPFESPFVFKNNGNLPLYDITYLVKISNAHAADHSIFQDIVRNGISGKIPELKSGRNSTFFVEGAIKAPPGYITSAEMYIEVSYKAALVPFTLHQHRRFKIDKRWDGGYVWDEYYSKE